MAFPTVSEMEVKSCKIVDSYYCILFNEGPFHIEDVDFQKILSVSKHQLEWFVDLLFVLVKEPNWKFFIRNGNDGSGATRLTKFRAPSGWFL